MNIGLNFTKPKFKINKMDKIKQTRETIAAKEAEYRKLMDGDLTDETRGQLDGISGELKTLNADLKRFEQAEEIAKRAAAPPVLSTTDGEEKEIKRNFSFADVLRAGSGERATGFLKEMHEEGTKELLERGLSAGNGIVLPTKVLKSQTRAAQVVGTDNVGGYLVETVNSGGIIEFLGDRLVLANMGVMTLDNLQGNVDFPTGTTGLTMTWEGETDDAAETNETFGKISYTPNRLAGYTDISKQLIQQGNPSISQYLSIEVRRAFARAIQRAAIHGNGAGIDGIVGTSGIGSVAIGTNGGAPTWVMITNLLRELGIDNADQGALSYLTNPKVIAKLQQTPKQSSGVEGNFILANSKDSLNGLPVAVTNAVSSTLTKGTSSGVCSALIAGNFNDMGIASWGGLEILFDPYTQAVAGKTRMHVNGYVDANVHRAVSFAACLDITTT